MSEYLSKEEIKQWRSSLEKITLEEYAARLGKKIEESKPTNDLVDIVLKGKPVLSSDTDYKQSHAERLSAIAERAFEREQQIAPTPFSINRITSEAVKTEKTKPEKTKIEKAKVEKKAPAKKASIKAETLREEVQIVFKKALTDREQKVFDYFAQNKGKIVYAKDLAALLDLPRDYVYKYIKNLRAKIEGEKLENADKGGFILNV
jgi:DNA-binding CsgD family transcriptional regulator